MRMRILLPSLVALAVLMAALVIGGIILYVNDHPVEKPFAARRAEIARMETAPVRTTPIHNINVDGSRIGILYELPNGQIQGMLFYSHPNSQDRLHGRVVVTDSPSQIIWLGGTDQWREELIREIRLNKADLVAAGAPTFNRR